MVLPVLCSQQSVNLTFDLGQFVLCGQSCLVSLFHFNRALYVSQLSFLAEGKEEKGDRVDL